jgi:hypothetical protein
MMKKVLAIILLFFTISSCTVHKNWVVFHIDKKFDGSAEDMFLNGNKVVTIKSDTILPFHHRQNVSKKQIKKYY